MHGKLGLESVFLVVEGLGTQTNGCVHRQLLETASVIQISLYSSEGSNSVQVSNPQVTLVIQSLRRSRPNRVLEEHDVRIVTYKALKR